MDHEPGIQDFFRRFSLLMAQIVGSPWAFLTALSSVIVWAITGPMFHFSDSWQLVINTATTIVTFLLVFLIQYTQNHDAKAIHLKLDELIRAVEGARTGLVNLENLTDAQLEMLQKQFRRLHRPEAAQMVKITAKDAGLEPDRPRD